MEEAPSPSRAGQNVIELDVKEQKVVLSRNVNIYIVLLLVTVNKLTHSHSYFSENYRAQLINDFPQSNYLLTVPVVVSLAVTSSHSSSP